MAAVEFCKRIYYVYMKMSSVKNSLHSSKLKDDHFKVCGYCSEWSVSGLKKKHQRSKEGDHGSFCC